MFRWIFDHRQLQISYKEVTKICNKLITAITEANNYKEIGKQVPKKTKRRDKSKKRGKMYSNRMN